MSKPTLTDEEAFEILLMAYNGYDHQSTGKYTYIAKRQPCKHCKQNDLTCCIAPPEARSRLPGRYQTESCDSCTKLKVHCTASSRSKRGTGQSSGQDVTAETDAQAEAEHEQHVLNVEGVGSIGEAHWHETGDLTTCGVRGIISGSGTTFETRGGRIGESVHAVDDMSSHPAMTVEGLLGQDDRDGYGGNGEMLAPDDTEEGWEGCKWDWMLVDAGLIAESSILDSNGKDPMGRTHLRHENGQHIAGFTASKSGESSTSHTALNKGDACSDVDKKAASQDQRITGHALPSGSLARSDRYIRMGRFIRVPRLTLSQERSVRRFVLQKESTSDASEEDAGIGPGGIWLLGKQEAVNATSLGKIPKRQNKGSTRSGSKRARTSLSSSQQRGGGEVSGEDEELEGVTDIGSVSGSHSTAGHEEMSGRQSTNSTLGRGGQNKGNRSDGTKGVKGKGKARLGVRKSSSTPQRRGMLADSHAVSVAAKDLVVLGEMEEDESGGGRHQQPFLDGSGDLFDHSYIFENQYLDGQAGQPSTTAVNDLSSCSQLEQQWNAEAIHLDNLPILSYLPTATMETVPSSLNQSAESDQASVQHWYGNVEVVPLPLLGSLTTPAGNVYARGVDDIDGSEMNVIPPCDVYGMMRGVSLATTEAADWFSTQAASSFELLGHPMTSHVTQSLSTSPGYTQAMVTTSTEFVDGFEISNFDPVALDGVDYAKIIEDLLYPEQVDMSDTSLADTQPIGETSGHDVQGLGGEDPLAHSSGDGGDDQLIMSDDAGSSSLPMHIDDGPSKDEASTIGSAFQDIGKPQTSIEPAVALAGIHEVAPIQTLPAPLTIAGPSTIQPASLSAVSSTTLSEARPRLASALKRLSFDPNDIANAILAQFERMGINDDGNSYI